MEDFPMKRTIALLLAAILVAALFTGCAGTTVVINECDCETNHNASADLPAAAPAPALPEGALKTGLAVVADVKDSTSATAEEAGAAKYEITVAAVTVDDSGVIHSCKLDVVPATVNMDASGSITSDLSAEILTKNEQGDDYGMVAYAGAIAEKMYRLYEFAIGGAGL
jgi:hypothetical protein